MKMVMKKKKKSLSPIIELTYIVIIHLILLIDIKKISRIKQRKIMWLKKRLNLIQIKKSKIKIIIKTIPKMKIIRNLCIQESINIYLIYIQRILSTQQKMWKIIIIKRVLIIIMIIFQGQVIAYIKRDK